MGQAAEDLEGREIAEQFKGARCERHGCERRYDLYKFGCYWCESEHASAQTIQKQESD